MNRLPDGSGFFTATIYSKRPPGFINWLKGRPNGTCRWWLFFWRNFRTARTDWGAEPHLRKLPVLKALRWSWIVSR